MMFLQGSLGLGNSWVCSIGMNGVMSMGII